MKPENIKKTLYVIAGIFLLVFIIQIIRYNIYKNNVKKALLDPSLRNDYKKYTVDGFHEEGGHTTAKVSLFPFCIKFFKWNNITGNQPCTGEDCIYWDNCKE